MALTKAGLKAAIIAALDAVSPTGTTDQGVSGAAIRAQYADAEADAILNYFMQNAEVVSLSPLPVTHPMGPGTVNPFTLPAGTTLK